MQYSMSRRALVKSAVLAATLVPVLKITAAWAAAAALIPLDSSDPAAKALGYTNDSSKVEAASNPTFKPDQACANCAQFQGKPGETLGGCNLFPGKSVAAKGWCRVWAKKPAG